MGHAVCYRRPRLCPPFHPVRPLFLHMSALASLREPPLPERQNGAPETARRGERRSRRRELPAPGPTNLVLLCPGPLSIITEEQFPLRETNGISLPLGWISAQDTEPRPAHQVIGQGDGLSIPWVQSFESGSGWPWPVGSILETREQGTGGGTDWP